MGGGGRGDRGWCHRVLPRLAQEHQRLLQTLRLEGVDEVHDRVVPKEVLERLDVQVLVVHLRAVRVTWRASRSRIIRLEAAFDEMDFNQSS